MLHAAQMGVLPMVAQRLDERARKSIKPGNVYVWEQQGYGVAEKVGAQSSVSRTL